MKSTLHILIILPSSTEPSGAPLYAHLHAASMPSEAYLKN